MQIRHVTDGNVDVSIVHGQEQPELLGWRIYGDNAKNWPVPTYEWRAAGTFCRAWVIQMQEREDQWPVQSVEMLPSEATGELAFQVHRRDGVDLIMRRFPGDAPMQWQGEQLRGDVVVISLNAEGQETSRLMVDDGANSVAGFRK